MSIPITLKCPKCGGRSRLEFEEDLKRWLELGTPIKGYCVACNTSWNANEPERAAIARAIMT
jgi:hypothetical protein